MIRVTRLLPRRSGYLHATRHPWPCLLFLLPLLLVYEGGIIYFGGTDAEALRNGADGWLRWLLQAAGLNAMCWPPILIAVIFLLWSWLRRRDRPYDLSGVWLGMAVESVIFALLLWACGQAQEPLVEQLKQNLHELQPVQAVASASNPPSNQPSDQHPGLALTISYVGAGIYEELLFRLLLFPLLLSVLSRTDLFQPLAVFAAMLLSALIFAGAHHIGPYGEPVHPPVFLFRTLAGLYFALLFQLRGFGVAVGAHACYDVMVGVAMS